MFYTEGTHDRKQQVLRFAQNDKFYFESIRDGRNVKRVGSVCNLLSIEQ
jgi:hypothetical protein